MQLQTVTAAMRSAAPRYRKCWAERLDLPPVPDGLARLLSHWEALSLSAPMPDRGAIRPEDLGFTLGYVNLVEIRDDPEQFVFRVAGTKIFERRPNADNIATVADITPRPYAELVRQHYREARDLAAPTLYRIFVSNQRDTRCYQRLLLPLAWNGKLPGMLLTASYFQEPIAQVTRTEAFLRDD